MLLQPYRDLLGTIYWTSVVLHEVEGERGRDCVISFLWFEEEGVAMGMDINPHTHVIHEGGKQGDVESKKDDYKKWKCNAFLEPSRHTQYHGYYVLVRMLYTQRIKNGGNAHPRDIT